jgi:hypothetical protein
MDPHQVVPNMTRSVKKDLLDCQEISCPASAVYTDPVNLHFSLSEFRILGRTSKTVLKIHFMRYLMLTFSVCKFT